MLLALLIAIVLNLTFISPVWILNRDIVLLEVLMHAILFFVGAGILTFGVFNVGITFLAVCFAYCFAFGVKKVFVKHNKAIDLLVVSMVSGFYAAGVMLLGFLLKKNLVNFDLSKTLILGNPAYLNQFETKLLLLLSLVLLLFNLLFNHRLFAHYFLNLRVSWFSSFLLAIMTILMQFLLIYVFGLIAGMAVSVLHFLCLASGMTCKRTFFWITGVVNVSAVCCGYYLFANFDGFLFGPTAVVLLVLFLLPLRFKYVY